jgi:streptogramin lyase
MAVLAECCKRLVRRGHVPRSASLMALVGVLVAFGVGIAGAAPLGAITEFSSGLNPGSNPAQVQAGPDGNLWFSDRAGAIGRITPGGTITEFSSGLNPGASDQSIAMGPDGNMWFSDNGTTKAVGMINPTTHAISEFSSGLNAGSFPLGIAAGPDGNVWFTDNGTTKAIGMINPATHAISEFSSGLNAGSSPNQGMVAGPDGNVWFTDRGTTKAIGMINPTTHANNEKSSSQNPGSSPGAALVAGPDGNLWFADNGTTQAIGMINPTTHAITEFSSGLNAGSSLGRIAAGPDGNLWFADKGTTPAIGMINPTTLAITEFSSGLITGSLPGGIGAGPDGNVWFTDQGVTRAIGRIGAGASAASVTPPALTGGGGEGIPQPCGGDVWSSWAGQQPSHSVYRFDGYQWLLDASPIAGATGSSYTPTVANMGHMLSCEATVTYTLFPVTVSATSASLTVLDLTPPVLSLPASIVVDATSPAGATVSYTVTATDNVDPSPVVSCTPTSGSTFAIGTTTVNCTATDASHNVAHGSFTVQVKGAAEQLADLAAAVAGVGPGQSLAGKVAQIQGYVAANDTADACGALGAFINEVNAQSGKKISTAKAPSLITQAQDIEAALGC